MHQMIAGSL